MNMSLIPNNYKNKDPRTLLYHFPSMPKVHFAKALTKFYNFKALEAVEEAAEKMGYILIPRVCMHWKRCRDYAESRKVKVMGKTYFMMKYEELTNGEKEKLKEYINEYVISDSITV